MFRALRNAAATSIVLLGTIAHAAPVQFDFVGVVTDDAINGCGGLVACGTVTGSYVFDSTALDANGAASAGLFDAGAVAFAIDGTPFFLAASSKINVGDGATDFYGVLAEGGMAANGSIADLSMLLWDSDGSTFGSDALPLLPGALAPMLPGGFTLSAVDDTFQLMGTITSITCSRGCGGGGGQTPEPATVALLLAGVCGLGLQRRRAPRAT